MCGWTFDQGTLPFFLKFDNKTRQILAVFLQRNGLIELCEKEERKKGEKKP